MTQPMDGRIHRLELLFLVVAVLVSLTLRVAVVRVDRIVRWDEPDYLIAGRNLFTGQGYAVTTRPEVHYAPLFPLIAGVLYPLTHNMKLNSDICYVLFGVASLLPFYWLARRLFGVRVAMMATSFLAVFPALTAAVIFWGTMLEPLYLLILCAALCATWLAWETGTPLPKGWQDYASRSSGERSLWAHVGVGALFGLAYLTKPEAIANLGLMIAWLVLANLWRRSLFTWRTVMGLTLCLVAFAVVIAPYIAFLYRHTGRIMITGKLGVTYVAGLGAVEHDPGLYDRALSKLDAAGEEIIWFSPDRFKYSIGEEISADPAGFLRRVWKNVNALEGVLFTRQVFPFYFFLLLGLAWFGAAWNKERALKELFLVSAVLPVSLFLPFHIELRYFSPMLPILLLWLAKGVDAMAEWLRQTWAALGFRAQGGNRLALSLCVLVTVLMVSYFLVLQPRVLSNGLANMNAGRREAGLWLKAHSDPQSLVMSRDTEVPFYAERRWVATPNEEYDRFIAYVRKRGGNYLVVDEREITVIRPQLSLLLNAESPPDGLRHVYTAEDPLGEILIYEVLY